MPLAVAQVRHSEGVSIARRRLLIRIAVVVVVTLSAAWALWSRQTPDALLRVDSFVGAIGEVAFWSLPAFVVFLVCARRPLALALCAAVLCLTPLQWWSSATDRHSTAGIGPGFLAMLTIVAEVVICVTTWRGWNPDRA